MKNNLQPEITFELGIKLSENEDDRIALPPVFAIFSGVLIGLISYTYL